MTVERKTDIRYIYEVDLDAYVKGAKTVMREDESGNRYFYIKDVDSQVEINLWTPNKVWLTQQLHEQKAKFEDMQEPSDVELKELGKETSQYYELKSRIERLEYELEKYK